MTCSWLSLAKWTYLHVQAISLAMQRIEGTQPNYEGDLLLAIPNGLSKEELREALTDIKKAVFAAWDEI